MISENLLLQTLEKIQVQQTWIFLVCHLDFFQIYSLNLAFFSRWRPRKKIQVFSGLKQTLISQDLDFQKSRCRLNGQLSKPLQDYSNATSQRVWYAQNHIEIEETSRFIDKKGHLSCPLRWFSYFYKSLLILINPDLFLHIRISWEHVCFTDIFSLTT